MGTEHGGADTLANLDMEVLAHARAQHGWAGLSGQFMRTGKERIHVVKGSEGGASSWVTSAATVLEFLGAYRKLMIDYLLTKYIAKLSASRGAKAYEAFLGRTTPLAEQVKFDALGSTNPTSDYDVTVSGPGVHCILARVLADFAAVSSAGKPADDDASTMSYMFDSNFYTGPDILVKRGERRFDGYTLFYPDGGAGSDFRVAVPVPTTAAVLDMERAYIMRKGAGGEATGKSIKQRYDDMLAVSNRIDALAYKGDGASPIEQATLFRLLFDLKVTSIEAYYGVSTVLVVVYGMQAKKLDALRGFLGPRNYQNACLENLFDFTAHWNEYVRHSASRDGTSRTAATDKLLLIKLSKYLQRMLVCLGEIRALENATLGGLDGLDGLGGLGGLSAEVDQLVEGRASGKSDVAVDLKKYGIPGHDFGELVLARGSVGLVHDIFAYLVPSGSTERPSKKEPKKFDRVYA
jgi:hypothetical protein